MIGVVETNRRLASACYEGATRRYPPVVVYCSFSVAMYLRYHQRQPFWTVEEVTRRYQLRFALNDNAVAMRHQRVRFSVCVVVTRHYHLHSL